MPGIKGMIMPMMPKMMKAMIRPKVTDSSKRDKDYSLMR
jgi:hypothetical protein